MTLARSKQAIQIVSAASTLSTQYYGVRAETSLFRISVELHVFLWNVVSVS